MFEGQVSSKLWYYTFAGMLVGLALTYSTQIAFSFSNCLHVVLADKEIDLEILQEADHDLYCAMKKLLTCNSDVFFDTISVMVEVSSEYSSVEQKLKYINRYLQSVYVHEIEDKLNCFKEGLDVVLGSSCHILIFNLLNFSDLEPLLCGSNELSVDDWERFVVYGGHDAIVLFWQRRTLMQGRGNLNGRLSLRKNLQKQKPNPKCRRLRGKLERSKKCRHFSRQNKSPRG